ncbi:MAG: M20/M25/M40 family metallo-hydrolase [Balneolaceae bacterium]
MKTLKGRLPGFEKELRNLKEILLANLVMIGEIPAPTFDEERRIRFLLDRFTESGIDDCSTDEIGNGIGVVPGKKGERSILIYAHADTLFSGRTDHTMQVSSETITGPGVADNSIGVAVLATMPMILEKLGIELEHNLILLGGVQSLGRGDLRGIRFFLENNPFDISGAICLEGVELGRLSYSSIGMLRGEITCNVPEQYDFTRFGDASAILTINEVINRINAIPLPKRPRTSIVMGQIDGGSSFNTIAREARLGFEVRSESDEVVEEVGRRIDEIGVEVTSRKGAEVEVDIFARRRAGGIDFSDPLARCCRSVMQALYLEPKLAPSLSELSALIDKEIPALTLGLTSGDRLQKSAETITIEPIYKGITQVLGTILAIDGGYCDGSAKMD